MIVKIPFITITQKNAKKNQKGAFKHKGIATID